MNIRNNTIIIGHCNRGHVSSEAISCTTSSTSAFEISTIAKLRFGWTEFRRRNSYSRLWGKHKKRDFEDSSQSWLIRECFEGIFNELNWLFMSEIGKSIEGSSN